MNSSPVATWPVCTLGRPTPSSSSTCWRGDGRETAVHEVDGSGDRSGGHPVIGRELDDAEQRDLPADEHRRWSRKVVLHELGGDDDVADRQVVVQCAGDAGEDDGVDAVVTHERRRGERCGDLADPRLDDRDPLAGEHAVSIGAPGVLGDGLGVEMPVQPLDLLRHRPDHADVPVTDRHQRIVGVATPVTSPSCPMIRAVYRAAHGTAGSSRRRHRSRIGHR
jgi:hypothetical protein